jgi:catechol 2,3-dioxygenase-like lactoylglutathione lyase family enzyme
MRIVGPVLDTADAEGLARFYERLLGWPIVELEGPRPGYPAEDGWAKLRSPSGDTKLEIQWEQHYTPPAWPAVPGEQQMMIHLDIEVDDLAAASAHAVAAGAVLAEFQPQEHVRVFLDPVGHPFCLWVEE